MSSETWPRMRSLTRSGDAVASRYSLALAVAAAVAAAATAAAAAVTASFV